MEDCDLLSNFDKKTKFLCAACTAFSIFVTTAVVLSFGVVEPTQYGIL
jgi:hypothetical protein